MEINIFSVFPQYFYDQMLVIYNHFYSQSNVLLDTCYSRNDTEKISFVPAQGWLKNSREAPQFFFTFLLTIKSPVGHIKNWNDTEKISYVPVQGWLQNSREAHHFFHSNLLAQE